MDVESRESTTEISVDASRIKGRQFYVGKLHYLPLIMHKLFEIYRRHSSNIYGVIRYVTQVVNNLN